MSSNHVPRPTAEQQGLLQIPDAELRASAARLTRQRWPQPSACAILSLKSGACSEDCSFCAQSRHHAAGVRAHGLLAPPLVLERARAAAKLGARRFGLVTSGLALSDSEFAQVCATLTVLKNSCELELCCSLGLIDEPRAARLKQAGLSRYHHNLETAASFFDQVCTTHSYAQDLAAVRAAQAAGLKTCCGGLFGLGESWDQRLELGLSLNELAVDAIPVNFLDPRPGTPLENQPLLSAAEALRTIAVLRHLNPTREIIVGGGRPRVLGAAQDMIFASGASGLMIGDYLTTAGSDAARDRALLAIDI